MSSVHQQAAALDDRDRPTKSRIGFRFTPGVYDQIRKLAKAGWNGSEIAERLGCSYPSLRVLCQRARISLNSGETLPPLTKPNSQANPAPLSDDDTMLVWLTSGAMERLRAEARHRATSPDRLAVSILRVVVNDQLFDAILD